MRLEKMATVLALCAGLLLLPRVVAGEGPKPPAGEAVEGEEYNSRNNIDDVVAGLITQFSKTKNEAMDAATKLAQMGRRSVPILADVLATTKEPQVRFYCTYALSQIRDATAAKMLLPLILDDKADTPMRLMAIGAVSGADLDEGVKPLQQVAATAEADSDLRFKALLALSVMIKSWGESEKLFVAGLGDTRDDIRQLSCKVCYQAAAVKIFYRSGEPKLIELAGKDPIPQVRGNAIAALARMKSKRAVAVLIGILGNTNELSSITKQALAATQNITGVPIRDAASAATWWEKFGKAEYENAPWLLRPEDVEKEKQLALEKEKQQAMPQKEKETAAAQPAETEKPPARRPPPPANKSGLQPLPEDKPFIGIPMGE